jgi:hypothetical protein
VAELEASPNPGLHLNGDLPSSESSSRGRLRPMGDLVIPNSDSSDISDPGPRFECSRAYRGDFRVSASDKANSVSVGDSVRVVEDPALGGEAFDKRADP